MQKQKNDDKYERSTNYRRIFLKNNKGVFHSGNYLCSYCGKLITPQKMTVDHLIPINKVRRRKIPRLIMWLRGIKNINDLNNLVPSCSSCNSQKSDKMGLWIIRGDIGKHPWYWIFKRSFILATFTIVIYTYRNELTVLAENIISKF